MSALERNKVYQSNELIEASQSMSLQEKRLLLCAASMIDSRKALPVDGYIKLEASAFASLFNMEVRHAYEVLEQASDKLWERTLLPKGSKAKEKIRWVQHNIYKEGEGYVELGFTPVVIKHLTLLNREFTGYQLKHVANLATFYAIRIYELLVQYQKLNGRHIELGALRDLLDLGTKYPDVKDFRRKVLTPSIEDINKHTDLNIVVEDVRKGRRVVGFNFKIKKSDQIPLGI